MHSEFLPAQIWRSFLRCLSHRMTVRPPSSPDTTGCTGASGLPENFVEATYRVLLSNTSQRRGSSLTLWHRRPAILRDLFERWGQKRSIASRSTERLPIEWHRRGLIAISTASGATLQGLGRILGLRTRFFQCLRSKNFIWINLTYRIDFLRAAKTTPTACFGGLERHARAVPHRWHSRRIWLRRRPIQRPRSQECFPLRRRRSISRPPHIDMARSIVAKAGLSNVEFIHVSRIDSLDALKNSDLFYSCIVLQHNPPPIISPRYSRTRLCRV